MSVPPPYEPPYPVQPSGSPGPYGSRPSDSPAYGAPPYAEQQPYGGPQQPYDAGGSFGGQRPYGGSGYTPVDELAAPLYGATLPQAVRRFFAKYATFSGRASRSEYWWWTLVNAIVVAVLYGAAVGIGIATQTVGPDGTTEPGAGLLLPALLLVLWEIAIIVPTYAICIRRLHDANFSGWLVLLSLLPVVVIGFIVLTILPSNPEGRRFDRIAV